MMQLHEACWLAFLVVVLVRGTVFTPAPMAWPLLAGWLALLAAFAWAWRQTRRPDARGRRWGWAYYPLAMNLAFTLLGPTIKDATAWRADDALAGLDALLVGENLSLRMEPWITPWLSDLMSLGYMSFMVLLFGALVFYLLRSPHLARCYRGLFTVYGLGFLGYVLVPAAGPYVAMAGRFSTPIEGGWPTALNALMVSRGSNHVNVFPSLHVAVSLFLWLTLLRDHRRLGLALTPLIVVLWASTIYLRYHYCIDLLAGAALAGASFLLADAGQRQGAPAGGLAAQSDPS
ncbi:phosphatase PAP2 family protein [Propionivibrio sp.]|uniref:phosphatase PAP2 family protein n=1 Tax=Propionivibrio sp. TaxID=2212460 RepID=UPI0039E71A03